MTPVAARLGALVVCLFLAACASVAPVEAPPPEPEPAPAPIEDPRINELRAKVDRLSAQLNDAQRRYQTLNEEHRRTEASLRESQKRLDDLQHKLDALIEIDRDSRKRRRP